LSAGFDTKTLGQPGTIHRVLLDRSRRTYFGYDVVVDVLPEAGTYRVTFRRLMMTDVLAREALWGSPADWTQLPSPRFPSALTVHAGDILAINLLSNGATGQTVTDYVTVQEPVRKFSFDRIPDREFAFATGDPRDFKAEDVEMHIQSPRMSIKGVESSSRNAPYMDATGTAIWIYVPKHGRFIFSLVPHPELGFRKAGEVRGTTLNFTVGPDTFELSSAIRVAPGQAAFTLYVLHQPSWQPTYPNADLSALIMEATDRAESLVEKSQK
jgi:hypothetical protein